MEPKVNGKDGRKVGERGWEYGMGGKKKMIEKEKRFAIYIL